MIRSVKRPQGTDNTLATGFKIATFNVNSIRSRLHIVIPWLRAQRPSVLCMQETKASDDVFPADAFQDVGYYVIFRGFKKGSGVAIASIEKPEQVRFGLDDDPRDEDRLATCVISGITILNAYVPQGFKPDTPQYAYKLKWLERFERWIARHFSPNEPLILCGDLNIAREPIDVHNPKRLLGHVDFNPEVWTAFDRISRWGLIDVFRRHHPGEPDQFSFFDYRFPHSVERQLGWRVDHILATAGLAEKSVAAAIDLNPRLAEKPSDHTVLQAEFALRDAQ